MQTVWPRCTASYKKPLPRATTQQQPHVHPWTNRPAKRNSSDEPPNQTVDAPTWLYFQQRVELVHYRGPIVPFWIGGPSELQGMSFEHPKSCFQICSWCSSLKPAKLRMIKCFLSVQKEGEIPLIVEQNCWLCSCFHLSLICVLPWVLFLVEWAEEKTT